jgi:DNA/RNA endonuclease YhcR with UshA esterase domain
MYIQDETAGIKIYLPKDHKYCDLGSKVELKGYLDIYYGEFEIDVSERGDVKCNEPGTPPPPLPVATGSLLEPYEGMLVILQGPAVDFKGRSTLWLDDSTGWAKVYIRQRTGIHKPFIERGTPIAVMGIVSQYSDSDEEPSREDYRLLPRYQEDLILPTSLPTNWPLFLPETGY